MSPSVQKTFSSSAISEFSVGTPHTIHPCSPDLSNASDLSPVVSSHDLFIWTSPACTGITVIAMGIHTLFHVFNYTVPREQRPILRIIALPAIYAICNLFSVLFYGAAIYIDEIPKICEAIALCSILKLYVFYITPGTTDQQRDAYSEHLDQQRRHFGIWWRLDKPKHDKGSLRWFKIDHSPSLASFPSTTHQI